MGLGDGEDLGVVPRLAPPLAHSYGAPRIGGRGAQGLLQHLPREVIGARAGEEDAAAVEELHGAEVYLLVSAGRRRETSLRLGKGGRVQNHSIVPLPRNGSLAQ